jgi:CRISPR-associated protein Cas2
MITWVIYDISENKIRNKVIRICKDAGLYRVQKSVFLGDIEDNRFNEIQLIFQDLIDLENDSVYIFPMSKKELKIAGLIGQAFDKKFVSHELISMFF